GVGFALSFVLALLVGFALDAAGLVRSPLLIAIILSATGVGIILPILKDAGETETALGRLVVAGASIAEVAPIVLLSLFFSGRSGGVGGKLVLLAAFVAFVVARRGDDRGARALAPPLGRAPATAGHERTDPGARRLPSPDALRRLRVRVRPRGHSRRLLR